MKKLIISLSIAVIVLGACQKKVTDIPQPNTLTPELIFNSADRMDAAVSGAYDALQSPNFLSGRALIYIDLQGEDVVDKNLFFGTLPRFDMLASNAIPAGVWDAGYDAIARANRAAAGISANATLVDATTVKALIAETKFVRAVAHFYLVNFFAQPYSFTANAAHPGVPIITENFTSNDPAANKPRASVAEVYSQIIQDLNDALADLPEAQSTTYRSKTRAIKAAAAAILSRVYLYMGDYANAKTFAGNIIAGQYGNFALNTSPADAFGPGRYETDETIWSIPNNVNDNPNTNNALPQHYSEFGRSDLAVSPSFTKASTNPYFTVDDKRRDMIEAGTTAGNTGFNFTTKYPDVTTRADWAPIIRYAEVLLTYAEATARLAADVDADAVAKLNLVRNRAIVSAAPYSVADFADKTELINAILGERRIELAFEGHRYFDLQRIKADITNKLDGDLSPLPVQPFGSEKRVFPIPQPEVDKSLGTLIQNPGF